MGATGAGGAGGDGAEISIHAPREGSDVGSRRIVSHIKLISIHAPREGSDSPIALATALIPHFNPRSPRGERRYLLCMW